MDALSKIVRPDSEPRSGRPEAEMLRHGALPSDLRARAHRYASALSRAFRIGVNSFCLVAESKHPSVVRWTVIDASPNGYFAGNYASIETRREADPGFMTVDLDGRSVDALAASTEGAYRAMVDLLSRFDEPLPDSFELSRLTDDMWTSTMAMGEPLQAGRVMVLGVCDGQVTKGYLPVHRGGRSIRVRPALFLAELAV